MRPPAALAALLLLAGCSTNREDQAFFESGWVKPQDGADRRLYGPVKAVESPPANDLRVRRKERDPQGE